MILINKLKFCLLYIILICVSVVYSFGQKNDSTYYYENELILNLDILDDSASIFSIDVPNTTTKIVFEFKGVASQKIQDINCRTGGDAASSWKYFKKGKKKLVVFKCYISWNQEKAIRKQAMSISYKIKKKTYTKLIQFLIKKI